MSSAKQTLWLMWDLSNGSGLRHSYLWLAGDERAAWLLWRRHRVQDGARLSRPTKCSVANPKKFWPYNYHWNGWNYGYWLRSQVKELTRGLRHPRPN